MNIRRILKIIAFLCSVAAFLSLFSLARQTRAEVIMNGVRKLKSRQCSMVPLSNKVTRILTRNEDAAEHLFRSYMKGLGWEYICHYGRSGLYRKPGQEVLARKTSILPNYCIYEVLDENYFKYMRSEIREAA